MKNKIRTGFKTIGKDFNNKLGNMDFKSINFKIWLYFLLFATLLLLLLWFLQIFFLNNYYEEMKTTETQQVAESITAQYKSPHVFDKIREISIKNDMYIHIETEDKTILFSPSVDELRRPSYAYLNEMDVLKLKLRESGLDSISLKIPESRTDTYTLAYAGYLINADGEKDILYIFSPLYPVSSTVDIIRTQLIYITIIALIAAFVISFYMSSRLSKPIRRITREARKLGRGEYDLEMSEQHFSEIEELASTIKYAAVELEKSSNMQKDMLANISHDLKTPITMVKSYAEMIRDLSGEYPSKRNEHLNVIMDEAERLNSLVNDILEISKMQSGAMILEKREFNLRPLLETMINSYSIWSEQGYTFTLNCPPDIAVKADEKRIEQVFSNLITNAIKYCGIDREIIINVMRKRKEKGRTIVRCEVVDHGKGIAEDEQRYIWERYTKASTNHVRMTSGSGLGLSIVKEILQLHDADFGVVSAPNKGAKFWFELKSVQKRSVSRHRQDG